MYIHDRKSNLEWNYHLERIISFIIPPSFQSRLPRQMHPQTNSLQGMPETKTLPFLYKVNKQRHRLDLIIQQSVMKGSKTRIVLMHDCMEYDKNIPRSESERKKIY